MSNKIIKFSIEGSRENTIYHAVDVHPERWNGWLCPIVTLEVAEQIANDLYELNKKYKFCNDEYCPSLDVRSAIEHARENLEDTVDVGCGLIWDLVEDEEVA